MTDLHTWKHGQKAQLARSSGVTKSYLCDVLKGRKRATPENAATISAEAHKMGLALDRMDLMYPFESANPLMEATR